MKKRSRQLENLYRQHAKALYFYLVRLSGSTHLAEDLTQETFVRATIHLHTYQGEKARAWLFRVARNVYLDEWRKQKRRKTYPSYQEIRDAMLLTESQVKVTLHRARKRLAQLAEQEGWDHDRRME